MKINIKNQQYPIAEQIFDGLFGYRQSLNLEYRSDLDITINAPYDPLNFNILLAYLPNSQLDISKYDLVLFCNGGEPLQVGTTAMVSMLKLPNVYLIANSYLDAKHPMNDRVIWYPHNWSTCRDYWTRHFYPQYFENLKNINKKRNNSLIAINGINRTWRHHFFQLMYNQVPDIHILSNINAVVTKLMDSQWESIQDQVFRDWVNDEYAEYIKPQPFTNVLPRNSEMSIGINNKFGQIPLGYFIMPEYFEYACVIFPETAWQNNELNITEKALKCFYAGSLPFPIGGANINQLYNKVGFSTAWNLLPDNLKLFDSVLNHSERYSLAVSAIKWLYQHPEVFQTIECQQMQEQNKFNFLTGTGQVTSIVNFDQFIQEKFN
jgi:hypothetical protein